MRVLLSFLGVFYLFNTMLQIGEKALSSTRQRRLYILLQMETLTHWHLTEMLAVWLLGIKYGNITCFGHHNFALAKGQFVVNKPLVISIFCVYKLIDESKINLLLLLGRDFF